MGSFLVLAVDIGAGLTVLSDRPHIVRCCHELRARPCCINNLTLSSIRAITVTPCAGINILAGSTLGGGTRVNWQASIRTPDHVRQEWAHVHGLKDLISYRYTAALDAVCARVGVTTGQPRLC